MEFLDFPALVTYLETQRAPEKFFRVAYTPYDYEYPLMMDLARLLGPVTLVIEEADRMPDPQDSFEYQEIIVRGRHAGVSIMALGLYPYLLPPMLRRQATAIYSFRQHEPQDIDWLRKVMGDDAYKLPDLADHEYLEWRPGVNSMAAKKLNLTKKQTKSRIATDVAQSSKRPTDTSAPYSDRDGSTEQGISILKEKNT